MSKTPYEIRLELLKMSKEMLESDFYMKRDLIRDEWQNKVSLALEQKSNLPSTPIMPEFPTAQQVLIKARELNEFVSNS